VFTYNATTVGSTIDGGADSDSATLSFNSATANLTASFAPGAGEQSVGGLTIRGVEKVVFYAGSGNDTITGGALDDTLSGGAGTDILSGGDGNDIIQDSVGQSGTLSGGNGDDTITVLQDVSDATSTFTISGGAGNDTIALVADTGSTRFSITGAINAGDGDDLVKIGAMTGGTVDLGQGNDRLEIGRYAGVTASVTLGGGQDQVLLSSNSAGGNLVITDFAAGVYGDRLDLSRVFGDGTNLFATGAATLLQQGADTVFQVNGVTVVTLANVVATALSADNLGGFASGIYVPGPANASGSGGPDTFYGTAFNDVLRGEGGDDVLFGADGDDTLVGGGDVDTMEGGSGDDTYYVDDARDVVIEGFNAGYDRILTDINFTIADNVERLAARDAAGTSALNLYGNGFANSLIGNAGANVLDGFAGADSMIGLGGNDVYFVDDSGDDVVEALGGGYDTVFANASYRLGNNVERVVTLDPSSTAAINFTGNALDNEMTGNAGANILDGGAGADLMVGGAGNDIYFVDNTGDVVSDAPDGGYDTVFTSTNFLLASLIERVVAVDGTSTVPITLSGNEFANEITGNAGTNLIDGKAGSDLLMGGGGADAFVFSTALGVNNIDALPDLVAGQDKIYLDHAIFAALGAGALSADAFKVGSGATDADDRIIYDPVTGALYYDADGNGSGAAVQFAVLHEGLGVTASDFHVI
jgi:serralysin